MDEMCRETGVSRAGFYRHWRKRGPSQEETELRERLQELALQQRTYGYRRITAQLRREGRLVNHKRVLRLLREDNLLALRKKRFHHDNRQPASLASVAQPSALDQARRPQSTLGCRHHLSAVARGVLLPGRHPRPLVEEGGGLVVVG